MNKIVFKKSDFEGQRDIFLDGSKIGTLRKANVSQNPWYNSYVNINGENSRGMHSTLKAARRDLTLLVSK